MVRCNHGGQTGLILLKSSKLVLMRIFNKDLSCCLLFCVGSRINGQSRMDRHLAGYESATTVMSSELETTSFCDSDDDDTMSRLDCWIAYVHCQIQTSEYQKCKCLNLAYACHLGF